MITSPSACFSRPDNVGGSISAPSVGGYDHLAGQHGLDSRDERPLDVGVVQEAVGARFDRRPHRRAGVTRTDDDDLRLREALPAIVPGSFAARRSSGPMR